MSQIARMDKGYCHRMRSKRLIGNQKYKDQTNSEDCKRQYNWVPTTKSKVGKTKIGGWK